MIYEPFIYTRDLRNDYHWQKKPDSMPASFYKYLQTFIYLREALQDDTSIDWNKIIFFIKHENMNVACRVLVNDRENDGQDYVGRTIYALEGLVSEDAKHRSVLAIPDCACFFLTSEMRLIDMYAQNELTDYIELEDSINPMLPLRLINDLPEEVNCSMFRALIRDIKNGKTEYDCLIGIGADTVAEEFARVGNGRSQAIKNVYDLLVEADDSEEKCTPLSGTLTAMNSFEKHMGMEQGAYELYIKFYKEGKDCGSYEWILRRKSDDQVIRCAKRKFLRQISVEQLIEEEQKIKAYYTLMGYKIH